MTDGGEGNPEVNQDFTGDEAALGRVRRVGALGPDPENAREMVDQLADAFGKSGVEVESVAAVPIGSTSILMIEIGEAGLGEVVRFLSNMLASGLDQPVVALIGNRAFTHRLNVALDAAGHGRDLLLPDEIIWVVPESLQETLRDLDDAFQAAKPPPAGQEDSQDQDQPPSEGGC